MTVYIGKVDITRAELEGITSSPYLSGAVLWHYTRHTWPSDAFYSGGQSISPYGYKSRDRKRNFEAMAVIEEYFKKIAESGQPLTPPKKDKKQ